MRKHKTISTGEEPLARAKRLVRECVDDVGVPWLEAARYVEGSTGAVCRGETDEQVRAWAKRLHDENRRQLTELDAERNRWLENPDRLKVERLAETEGLSLDEAKRRFKAWGELVRCYMETCGATPSDELTRIMRAARVAGKRAIAQGEVPLAEAHEAVALAARDARHGPISAALVGAIVAAMKEAAAAEPVAARPSTLSPRSREFLDVLEAAQATPDAYEPVPRRLLTNTTTPSLVVGPIRKALLAETPPREVLSIKERKELRLHVPEDVSDGYRIFLVSDLPREYRSGLSRRSKRPPQRAKRASRT